MPSRVLDRQRCLKRGCVLTCYVNGRKRFRAFSLDFVMPFDKPPTEPARPSGLIIDVDRTPGAN